MKMPVRRLLALALLLGVFSHARADEPGGSWRKPSLDGKAWKHEGTGLTFPQHMGEYRLKGEFSYDAGGVFVRYENLDLRARADIFLFRPADSITKLEDRHLLIIKEMDSVVADLKGMASQGHYKDIQVGDLAGGEIPLWHQAALPIATRTVTCTRIGNSKLGVQEAPINQWIGITVVNGYVLTIRHMRPVDTGNDGQEDMKGFVSMVFQIIKDPPLRADVKKLVEGYLHDPFSKESEQATGAVLAYLNQSPFFPISIPEHPVSVWLDRCKAMAPGTEDQLLRAFMLGSAQAAFNDESPEACLNAGSRQFALVYKYLLPQYPRIELPEINQFAAAAEKGKGADWLKENLAVTK